MVAVVLSLLVALISVYQLNYLLINLNYGIHTLWRRRMAVIIQNSACTSGTIVVLEIFEVKLISYSTTITKINITKFLLLRIFRAAKFSVT